MRPKKPATDFERSASQPARMYEDSLRVNATDTVLSECVRASESVTLASVGVRLASICAILTRNVLK